MIFFLSFEHLFFFSLKVDRFPADLSCQSYEKEVYSVE